MKWSWSSSETPEPRIIEEFVRLVVDVVDATDDTDEERFIAVDEDEIVDEGEPVDAVIVLITDCLRDAAPELLSPCGDGGEVPIILAAS